VKRLRGWDAVLLYSETPNVHMHTLKLAVTELDDLGGRQDRQHTAGPQQAALGDVLHRRPGQRADRRAGQDPSRAVRRVASAKLLARGMDLQEGPQADRDSYATDPAPSKGELVRSALRDHVRLIRRSPGEVRYTAQGVQRVRRSSRKLSPELTRPFTPPPTFMNHKVDPAMFRWLSNNDGQNKVLNLPISNVPGPREHGRVGGALVTEIYSVGPLTAGSGLNITVWSYVDQLNISVLSDGSTLKDPHELTDAMIGAFVEIRQAAGLSEELTVVEKAMEQ
jgi:hypothetical protein